MQKVKVSEYSTLTGVSFENWGLVKIAEKTKANWYSNLNQFLVDTGLTSESLTELYRSDGAVKVCNLLLAYFQRLEREGQPNGKGKYSYGKFKVTYLAFMSLFASNEIDLAKDANGKIKTLREYTKTKSTESSLQRKTPQKDQVKAIIDNASTYRIKALASVLSESGCRIGDASNFRYSQIEPILKSGEPFGYFLIIQEKIETPAMVALGPNSIRLLKMFLSEREAKTGKPIQPNDPLFCSYEERKDEPNRRGSHVGEAMDSSGLTQSINAVIAKCKFPKRYSTHKLRSYFIQSLQKAGLDMSIICSIIGKSRKGTESPYVLTLPDNEVELFDFYVKYYPALAIDQPTILQEIEDSRFKKMEETIRELQDTVKSRDSFILSVGGFKPDADIKVIETTVPEKITLTPEQISEMIQREVKKALESKKEGAV